MVEVCFRWLLGNVELVKDESKNGNMRLGPYFREVKNQFPYWLREAKVQGKSGLAAWNRRRRLCGIFRGERVCQLARVVEVVLVAAV